jgi:intracellular septation protein A
MKSSIFKLPVLDEDWWIVYAVVFGAIALIVIFFITLLCYLEMATNKEM